MKSKKLLPLTLVGIAVIAVIGMIAAASNKPAPLDEFASCLKDKGATFYGAFWCPHCQTQKKLFGKSANKLPYVECSLSNGKGQTKNCTDKKIEGYPTWEFGDGSRESGELSLGRLAEKTNCALPSAQ
ncbi:hypothetical protein HY623_04575 [Candidatus Uhrbacteria bacterium]|nr:hypothetical protein [Candidatus Uhrbacteria bacterium]